MTRIAAAAEIIRLGDIIRDYRAAGLDVPAPIGAALGDANDQFDLLSGHPHIPTPRKAGGR